MRDGGSRGDCSRSPPATVTSLSPATLRNSAQEPAHGQVRVEQAVYERTINVKLREEMEQLSRDNQRLQENARTSQAREDTLREQQQRIITSSSEQR